MLQVQFLKANQSLHGHCLFSGEEGQQRRAMVCLWIEREVVGAVLVEAGKDFICLHKKSTNAYTNMHMKRKICAHMHTDREKKEEGD